MMGWESKPLGKVCKILDSRRKPVTKKDRRAGEYPYYGATGIVDYVDDFIFDEPLVLVGEDGAKWGSGEGTAFSVSGRCWVNNHAHVLRPIREQLLDDWLVYHLVHQDLSPFVSGLTVPKLSQGNLREIPVPLPPLPEQRRVVAILDEAFEGIATAKANAEKNLKNARSVLDAVREEVFSAHTKNFVSVQLGTVCDFENGDRGKNYPGKQHRVNHGVPFINTGHLTADGIDFGTMDYISQERFSLLGNGKIKPKDILFCLRGSLGKFASVGDLTLGAIASSLVILRPRATLAHDYLLAYLSSTQCADMVNRFKGGAAQPNLGAKDLKHELAPENRIPC